MIYLRTILITLLFSTALTAYQDYDIDGVEDSIDRCPNTDFDKLVDKWGCPQDSSYSGSIISKVGVVISTDKDYDTSSNLNFFMNYRYYDFDILISNANYTVFETPSDALNNVGDVYVSGGYTIRSDKLTTKINLGMKISTVEYDEESSVYLGTGENDIFGAINLNYMLQSKQNIFLYYGYTKSGDSADFDYKNTHSYALGSGYALTSRWYSSISYESSSSVFYDVDDYRAVSWFNSYSLSKTFFTTFNYAYTIDELSYDNTFSIKFGIYFE